jgi:uncharacterized protein YjbI with pentapeptide repeats
MSGDRRVRWATCIEDACQGIHLRTGDRCLAHADSQDRDAELKRFAEAGRLDARGVRISAELLKRILDAAPPDEDRLNRPRLTEVNFDGADFDDNASFAGATFGDHARFEGASFGDHARFRGATFGVLALFRGATFGDHAWFDQVRFGGLVPLTM